jgi:hypothetical protein
MSGDATAQRVSLFCVGGAVTAPSAFLAVFAFNLATMMMNPALQGTEYWEAVRERLESGPTLLGLMVTGSVGAVVGLVLMGRAIFGPFRAASPSPASGPAG